jgi:CRP/FNR family transcriptional regulator, cyclic AMP receptor protein
MASESGHPPTRASLDPDVGAAIDASHLGSLSEAVLEMIAGDATRLRVPAASTIHPEGERSPHLEVVVSGLVRVYVTAPDGRAMTVRYCRPGALIGVVSLFATPFSLPATIQAVTDADLFSLRPAAVRRAADHDVRVARALLEELSERVLSFMVEIPGSAFATVRQRVARHLLDLASERQRGSELVAEIGQQDLADAVGSVREVVVRALRELRQAGLLETRRDGILLVDPERLLSEVYPREGGTDVPPEWNQSR